MTFTLIGAALGIIAIAGSANPLFPIAFLAVGYGIDRNRKIRQ